MPNDGSLLIIVLIALFIAVCAFVVLRYFMLWYWRIDRIVDLMEEQNQLLKTIATDRNNRPPEPPAAPRPNPLTGK